MLCSFNFIINYLPCTIYFMYCERYCYVMLCYNVIFLLDLCYTSAFFTISHTVAQYYQLHVYNETVK